jgi:hypothetical protein
LATNDSSSIDSTFHHICKPSLPGAGGNLTGASWKRLELSGNHLDYPGQDREQSRVDLIDIG